MISRPFEHVKREMAAGIAAPSFTSDCLGNFETDTSGLSKPEQEHLVVWAAGAMYGGKSSYTLHVVVY